MPPRNIDPVTFISEDDSITNQVEPEIQQQLQPPTKRPPMKIVWKNVMWISYLHMAGLYGLYLLPSAKRSTVLWTVLMYYMSAMGITAGAHRLWSHRSYKAKLPLRVFLAWCNSMAFQNDIIEWSRDHRVHHKYSETEADPHNANRGFFFSHCGWLMCKKHPEVKEKGQHIDMSDLEKDPVCAMQRKLYIPSLIICCFTFPAVVPWYFWGENLYVALFVCSFLRYVLVLNFTWCVNSVAHIWGNKPYDMNIGPVESWFVAAGAAGEGFHNYHHTFPHDYRTSEFGFKFNPTTMFVDLMCLLGLASDRKKMTQELVDRRKERTGDGTEGFGYFQHTKSS